MRSVKDTADYVARQPILDTASRIVGYELLFRAAAGPIGDGLRASASVAATAFADPRFADVLGGQPGFVNVDAKFLASDMIEALPPGRVVLELLEDTIFTPGVLARCRELKARGYTLASDDYVGDFAMIASAVALLDIIKVDVMLVAPAQYGAIARQFPGKTLLAEKVETAEVFRQCRDAGYTLFQGYYFAKPETLGKAEPDPGRVAALGVLALVARDAEDEEIEDQVKHHPALGLGLLRLVNSAAAGLARPIESIRQALMLLGRKQLERWLQLLVYVGTGSADLEQNPLLQLAAVRAKTMELLARRLGRTGERAFLVGLVSLFDVALGLSRSEIAARLLLDAEISAALERYEGELGALFALAEAMERGDDAAVRLRLAALPAVRGGDLAAISAEALRWAAALGEPKAGRA